MNSDKAKNLIAAALVVALAVVLWQRFAPSAQPAFRPQPAPLSAPQASVPVVQQHRAALVMPRHLLRNPFRPGKEIVAQGLPDYRRLNVSMIAVGKSRADTFARINGRILHVGGSIGGFKVLGISKRGVWVQRAGEKKHFIRIF